MQLPGMSTDPIRVSLDVTFDPERNEWSLSERQWRWYSPTAEWRLEAMYTSGSPMTAPTAASRFLALARACSHAVQIGAPPFGEEPFPESP